MTRRLKLTLFTALLLGLLLPGSSFASVAQEQAQGQKLAQHVQSGERSCKSLTADDLDHIGEFVMGRMVGSTSIHEAMNQRMIRVMGEQAESRMHQVLGARFVGCTGAPATSSSRSTYGWGMMGSGPMMRSGAGQSSGAWSQGSWGSMMGSRGWGSMMGSGAWQQMMGSGADWSWMMNGRWKTMSNSDWSAMQKRWLGTATIRANRSSWNAGQAALMLFAVILAAGLVGALFAWHPWRR